MHREVELLCTVFGVAPEEVTAGVGRAASMRAGGGGTGRWTATSGPWGMGGGQQEVHTEAAGVTGGLG